MGDFILLVKRKQVLVCERKRERQIVMVEQHGKLCFLFSLTGIDVMCIFKVLAVFIRFFVETINNEASDLLI